MKKNKRGYILIYKPEHPLAQRGGWVLEHRLKMEEYMGRYLTKEEVVHHIDGNKSNNFAGNLMLFATHGEHVKYHLDHGWRERIRKESSARKQTEATREKCRISKLGNKHCVGRVMGAETRRKISESNKRTKRALKGEVYATY